MVKEAEMEITENGKVVKSDGWFVLHASEAPWWKNEKFGAVCNFEGETPFKEFGINVHVMRPGQPACLYHSENAQESFLVLSGECTLLIENEERHLKTGHFVHCPPGTEHVFVGAGTGPCVILMAGARPKGHRLNYPVNKLAVKHDASAVEDTEDPREAYSGSPRYEKTDEHYWPRG